MTAPDSAWHEIQQWLGAARNGHRLTRASPADGDATLAALEWVTERSVLGALAREAGSLVVDDWLLILGAGGGGHPGLREFNGPDAAIPAIPGALVAAVDVLGGTFAINGGGLPTGGPGAVCYLGPDTLEWMDCGFGHGGFVHWALTADLDQFYGDLRWAGWRDLTQGLAPGEGVSVYPFPWSKEYRLGDVSRRPAPLAEVCAVLMRTVEQLAERH